MVKVFLLKGLALTSTLLVIGLLRLLAGDVSYDNEFAGDFRATRLWLPFHTNSGFALRESFIGYSTDTNTRNILEYSISEEEQDEGANKSSPESPNRARCSRTPES